MIKTQIGSRHMRLVNIKPIEYINEEGSSITLAWIQVSKGTSSMGLAFLKDGTSFERDNATSPEINAKRMYELMNDRYNQDGKNTILK